MKITTTLKKIGTGYYILIPSTIRNLLNIREGDVLEIDIIKVVERNYKDYICRVCEHKFCSNDDVVYCPVCGSEKIREVKK